MANADLGSLDFKLILDDKEFNKSVNDALQRAKDLNVSISALLDLRRQYNRITKDDVTNARNTNRILREENKTREMNRREIIKTRKELVKLNAEKARANGIANGGSLSAQASMMSNLTSMAMKYVSIWGAASLIKNIANVTAEFELQKVALEAMIADTQKANQVYNQIWDLALKSPFNAKELVTYAKQLVAYSIPVNELFETTKMLADVSAGLGVGMDRLVLAYGQIRSASFLRGQEVRQLTEAGIPILEELRKQFVELGEETITVGDVFDKISKRLVPFEMVEKVFKNMTTEGGKFYQMQEIQAETLKGKIMILKDAYDKMFNAIGTKNKSTLKSAVEWAANMARNYDKTMGTLKSLIAAYGAYKVALELAILGERGFLVAATIKKITETATRMRRLTGEAKTFAVIMRNLGEANVKKAFATLAGAIALVSAAIIVAVRNAGALKRELKEVADAKFSEATRSIKDFDELVSRLQHATKGSQKYRDAISELNNKYGDYLPNLLNEKNALDEIAASYDKVTNAIYSQAKAYAYEEGVRKLEEKQGIRLADEQAALVNALTKMGTDKEAAQIFVRNFTDALADTDQWTDTERLFRDKWNDIMGGLPVPIADYTKDWANNLRQYVKELQNAAQKYKEAEQDLADAIEVRFGGEGYSTLEEKEKISEIQNAYAQKREEIMSKELSAGEVETELEKAKIEYLQKLIKAYEELNEVAAEAGKAGLWDNQLKKYTAELNALKEPDLSWLQKIVNPLVDDKNRDLKPLISDKYEDYIDNLRNVYKKQVGLVDDLTDTYNKYLDARKRGIKDEDNAYTKSKELYEIEKKRKEIIEAIGKALGISVDDKVNKGSGKSEEQLRLETQINTLKDLEKWYGKLKDLGMGDDDIRDTLKGFFPDAEMLNTSRSFRDELLKLADALEKFDKKAAQALRDDVSGYGLDDLIDRIKKSLEASKKLNTTLNKLKEETVIEGTGTTFDITKIVHDYAKAVRDINDKRQEAWNEAYKSFEAGNAVDIETVAKEIGDWWETQTGNELNKAINSIDEKAEQWIKEWAKVKGVNLEDWSDMTIAQLRGVRIALEQLFDEDGNLIEEGDENLNKIKESLADIPGGWEAFVKAIQRGIGVKDFSGEGLLKKLQEMTTKEKVQLVKYCANAINDLADSLISLGEATSDTTLKGIGSAVRDISSLASDVAEGFAVGGWIGAAVGALKNIGTAIMENAAAAAKMNAALSYTANVTSKIFRWDKDSENASGNIFGSNDLAEVRQMVAALNELNKEYSRLAVKTSEGQEGLYGLADDIKKRIEGFWVRTYDPSKGFWGWIDKFFEDRQLNTLKNIADELGYELFDEYGYVSSAFLRQVLDIYGDEMTEKEKGWMTAMAEFSEKAVEYIKKIEDAMGDLVGSVADSYADSIIDQWVEAGNAAANYADILDDVARAYAKLLVKNVLMDAVFNDIDTKQLTNDILNGETDKAMQTVENALKSAQNLAPTLEPILEMLNKYLRSDSDNTLGQGIKGITEDTANLLASYINGMRADVSAQRIAVESIQRDLGFLSRGNYTKTLEEYLNDMSGYLADIQSDTGEILSEMRGIIMSEGGTNKVRVAL